MSSYSPSPVSSSSSSSSSASPHSILGPSSSSTPPTSKPGSARSTPKPVNVFTNDGSFLERIRRSRMEEEKNKEKELLEKKKNFDNRFKTRGKRPPPDPIPSSDTTSSPSDNLNPPAKKSKSNAEHQADNYQRQVKSFINPIGMRDTGTGIRPFVK